MSEPERAVQWHAYAGAAIADMAASHPGRPRRYSRAVPHRLSEIADEMVKRAAERLGNEED